MLFVNAFILENKKISSFRLVIDTLKEVEKERKCFRMIGGVLVERTVAEVLPALEQNKDQVTNLINW
jgi:prefoldin subunit 2